MNNLHSAETLHEDRDNEILALERELKLLEGDDGEDEDEPSPLDSSQTQSLSASISKQMAVSDSTTMTPNEMNEIK